MPRMVATSRFRDRAGSSALVTRAFSLGSRCKNAGFTLIELLIVIIIVAMLAVIAIPTFLSQRTQAQDAAAYSLVRNGLTVIQSATVETGGYEGLTAEMLHDMEQSIHWIVFEGPDLVTVGGGYAISDETPALARFGEVVFHVESDHVVDLASQSESGNWFGIQVDAVDLGEIGYIKVKILDGSATEGW